MEKEKFISKLNIKDYNNQLERILVKKTFSEDIKNLLLSMLYKIENAYSDYHRANIDSKSKKEILEEIIDIIENDCEIIELTKKRESKSIKEQKKIITNLNEKSMLYELYQVSNKKFIVSDKYEIVKKSLENTLNQAYSIAGSEIIRDFDGWSWNIIIEEIENIRANFIYQAIKILVGNAFLTEWTEKGKEEDYYDKIAIELQKKYKNELGENILKLINQLAIINWVNYDKQERKKLEQIEQSLQKEFDEINNKEEYIKNLVNIKKRATADIKKIDKIVNDDKLLKKEFIYRNEKLDMDHRIFSLSDFVDILQSDRENLIKEIDKCSKKMEPLNYIKTKTDIENKLDIIKELDLKNINETYNKKTKEFLDLVCKAIKIQAHNITDKEEIIKLIYIVRYLGLIYINKDKQIKDIVSLNKIQKDVITEACKQKAITIFSKNIKENYQIAKNIFEINVIELEKVFLKFIPNEDKTILEIYDEDNLYKTIQLKQIQDINVKYNKKIKFVIS